MLVAVRMFTALIILLSFSATPWRCATPNFTELETSKNGDETTLLPVDKNDIFPSTHGTIYVTGRINHAVESVEITIKWFFMGDETHNDEAVMLFECSLSTTSGRFMFLHTENGSNGWEIGYYEARLFIDDKHEETLTFNIIEGE